MIIFSYPAPIVFNLFPSSETSILTTYASPGVAQDAEKFGTVEYTLSASEVPVPATVWLFGSALVGLLGFKRKK